MMRGIAEQIAGFGIIRAINNNIMGSDKTADIARGEAGYQMGNLDLRIDRLRSFRRQLRLAATNIFFPIDNLTVQIAARYKVFINDRNMPDASGGQIQDNGRAQPTSANNKNFGGQ